MAAANMWSHPQRREEAKDESPRLPSTERNVRFIHMQISTPMTGNKTRAQKVKEALMIIFATSKFIKLHPKEAGVGEIITNIDDLVTTEEVTEQYFFDKKKGGKKYVRGEGALEYYVTKVKLETDIGLTQMKWKTSTKFLEALKAQHVFLQEYQDGEIMRTGNVGWLVGKNPSNTSITKVTQDLNNVLSQVEATAILDVHTVSIRFPQKKTAFVTRAYKIMTNLEKIDKVKDIIQTTLKEKKMGVGWGKVDLITFNTDKNTTAMMIEKQNKYLHNTAVISIKNIWSITERDYDISDAIMTSLGLSNVDENVTSIEELWWMLANKYQHDVQGMVTRRGTLEILTTRKNLDDTVAFARDLLRNTTEALGPARFAKMTANHNPNTRFPVIQEAPMILSGPGRLKLDTTLFTEQEFKNFANKHGIPLDKKTATKEISVDTTRPPKAFFHKAGREPVEHDPRKMREGAKKIWESFVTSKTTDKRKKTKDNEKNTDNDRTDTSMSHHTPTTSDEIANHGKMTRFETSLKRMKDSQDELERTTQTCQEQIINMTKKTEDSIDRMSEMITQMGDSITIQNRQLEAQAKAQVKQAEDIQRIMTAIQAISSAVQTTPAMTPDYDSMQIDIPQSNYNKRKQTSIGLTTPFTDVSQESNLTSSQTAKSQNKGEQAAGRQ
jgi:hypothetical protein